VVVVGWSSSRVCRLKNEILNRSVWIMKYNREFPENYNWDLLDSNKLSDIANKISLSIVYDLETTDRIYAPGLRLALNHIADYSGLK
jgi:hypothetical protein